MACSFAFSFATCLAAAWFGGYCVAETVTEECQNQDKGSTLLMRDLIVANVRETLVEDVGEKPQMRHTRAEIALANVRGMVTRVVKEGTKLDNVTRDTLSQMETFMNEIIDEGTTRHATAQKLISETHGAMQNCKVKATEDMTKSGGVDELKGLADEARTKHANCRKSQKQKQKQKVQKCNDFKTKTDELAAPPACGITFPGGPIAGTEEYIQNIATWLKQANDTYSPRKQACESSTSAHVQGKEACDNQQASFEAAFCNFAQSLTTTCNAQNWCREEHNSTFNEVFETQKDAQPTRKLEYIAASKVICYLGVLKASPSHTLMSTKLSVCDNATYDTSHLALDHGDISSALPCDTTPVTHTACDAAFQKREYASQAWYGYSQENAHTSQTETVRTTECAAKCPVHSTPTPEATTATTTQATIPTWLTYTGGNAYTWSEASAFCASRGGQLCTKAQYCPSGSLSTSIAGNANGQTVGDRWSPYGNSDNGWIQTGNAGHATCTDHNVFGAPSWGTTGSSHGTTMCCDKPQATTVTTTTTAQADA